MARLLQYACILMFILNKESAVVGGRKNTLQVEVGSIVMRTYDADVIPKIYPNLNH